MIDISNILGKKEGLHLEAKSAKGGFPDSFWESYSAFANTDGGVILLGVEEKPDHSLYVTGGVTDAEKMTNDFWNMVNNRQKVSHNIVTNSMVYVVQIDGKSILVVEVPRAERTIRPVYKGQDPRNGTFRRWNEGDHLCSVEEVGSILRDASFSALDATPIKDMDMSVFCDDTINGYRNVFKSTNPNHQWNKIENEMFLRHLNAIAMADDGKYHPTEAGLLMFGYEYEITRHFPRYFLDYQEDRVMVGVTRWKDRITSSSGDWSGNLFDFTFKVLPKLQADLKIPFVLKGMQRVDDTPMHKLLREAVVNTLSNADYWGRQGVVISKNKEGFTFANPGRLRISKSEAIGGCTSDPRNSTILKFFSLIRFGERAGSGLNGIMYVWNHVYHTEASIDEKDGEVDRTILTLPFNGHEQDVDAMLQLYDDYEQFPNDVVDKSLNRIQHTEDVNDRTALKQLINDRLSKSPNINDKLSITADVVDKLVDIVCYIRRYNHAKAGSISNYIGKSVSRTREYLQALIAIKMVLPEGGNKNRTYSVVVDNNVKL